MVHRPRMTTRRGSIVSIWSWLFSHARKIKQFGEEFDEMCCWTHKTRHVWSMHPQPTPNRKFPCVKWHSVHVVVMLMKLDLNFGGHRICTRWMAMTAIIWKIDENDHYKIWAPTHHRQLHWLWDHELSCMACMWSCKWWIYGKRFVADWCGTLLPHKNVDVDFLLASQSL